MKVLLLDADGVVLKKGPYFSTFLAEKQNVPVSIVTDFFKKEYLQCQSGELDLKSALEPYLKKWNWHGTVDDLLDFWNEHDTVVDESVVEHVISLRKKGVKCYMASNNERYRAEYIRKVLDARSLLDGYFFSSDDDIRARKSNPEFFGKVLQRLGVAGEDVTYIDDDQSNLDAAQTHGITAHLYQPDIFDTL